MGDALEKLKARKLRIEQEAAQAAAKSRQLNAQIRREEENRAKAKGFAGWRAVQAEMDENDEFAATVMGIFDRRLRLPRERALFDLAPLPSPVAVEPAEEKLDAAE